MGQGAPPAAMPLERSDHFQRQTCQTLGLGQIPRFEEADARHET